jgi:hypothetical protein
VFTFIPESCSRSSRNTVRNHPGIAFILPRIPQTCANAFPRGRDRFLSSYNLLILESRQRRQKPQKQRLGTKSVQMFFPHARPNFFSARRFRPRHRGANYSLSEKKISGGNPAVTANDEISTSVSRRLARATRYPLDRSPLPTSSGSAIGLYRKSG